MQSVVRNAGLEDETSGQADALFGQHRQAIFRQTDRLFAGLLAFEWLAGVLCALWLSPLAWEGLSSHTHPHVWAALFLGGAVVSLPILLALTHPGAAITRHAVAVGQMLFSALLIHLTGGRLETHFHVFGSLAFLAFYRDWRVLVTASAVVTADHFLRGLLWPQSVFGVLPNGGWRWLEHAGWVIFEDIFLIYACLRGVREMRGIADRQARLEAAHAGVEATVRRRTAELSLLQGLTAAVAEASDIPQALTEGLGRVCAVTGWTLGQAWLPDLREGCLVHAASASRPDPRLNRFISRSKQERFGPGQGLPGQVWAAKGPVWIKDIRGETNFVRAAVANEAGLCAGMAIPILAGDEVLAVVEFFTDQPRIEDQAHLNLVSGVAAQLGNVLIRKRAEEELSHNEQRYRSLVETTSAIVWTMSASGEVAGEMPGWSAFTGQTYPQIQGWGWLEAVHPEDRSRTAQAWSAAVAGRSCYQVEHRLRRHDGEYRYMLARGVPLLADAGRVREWIGVHADIHESKRAEAALREAKEAAEASCRVKSEFLANMSHEIRTPMNGVLGMIGLTLETDLEPEQRDFLQVAQGSAEALLTVINDVLDFSKIEAGKLELEVASFDLREALGDTLKTLALLAHQKGLELNCQINSDVPRVVAGDAGRLRQVVLNLAGNAIKFTERGEVNLSVAVESRADDAVVLHFAVADTGVGVPPDKLRLIFEPFTQADGSTTRKYGGTGLGLSISSLLVGRMGGRIWAESKIPGGSTFHFTAQMALSRGATRSISTLSAGELRGLAALVVDDNATNRQILEVTLRGWGMLPFAVESGAAALAELKRATAVGTPYLLVLLDAQMPGMDGFTVAEQINRDLGLTESTVMMLTSLGHQVDAGRCRELGLANYLVKPVKQSELLRAVLSALAKARSCRPAAPIKPSSLVAKPLASAGRLRVLLADDNPVNQLVAMRLLENQGHSVVVTCDGRQALDALARERFDIALLDIQMPELDGFEVAAAVRAWEAGTGHRLPLVALTAHAMPGDQERCLNAGMDGYVSKPIRLDNLLQVMEDVLPSGQAVAHAAG